MGLRVSAFQRGHPPRATYRLQFNEQFRLADALAIVPYLRELGISHLYASPLTKARPHSTHGYDVCDFQQLNPELGTEDDLEKLVAALRENQMGLVLDIVPNHMGIGPENPWWWDVLTHGRRSAFAEYFDIDWESRDPRTRGKVLLPVLGGPYSRMLQEKQITLAAESGGLTLRYGELQFPLTPDFPLDAGEAKAMNENLAELDGLIQRQNYRLVFWKRGDAELNYRRFFSIASLAGLRVEEGKVFSQSHALVKKWVKNNWLDGLRVDHPDGLREPGTYLRRLRSLAPEAWIVVEKILEPGECLPHDWPVAGTTGYDFLNQTNALFVNPENERVLTAFYAEFTGERTDYDGLAHDKKRAALDILFAAEIKRLVEILVQIAGRDWRWRDFTSEELRDAMTELAACFPVYRTYGHTPKSTGQDSENWCIERAVASARLRKPDLPPEVFDMLAEILPGGERGDCENEFAARFQQLTGPAMAKGVEDTAFYCFNRFVSLNEVGGDPGQFGAGPESFHEFCATQQRTWPDTMLASSTHDTKRGEDLRARLSVLSEIPAEWMAAVGRWAAMNKEHHRGDFPDPNAEYLFYQTLVGAWPLSVERASAYMEKAAREAKQHTNWSEPNAIYERSLREFVAAVMNTAVFMEDFEAFVASIADAGFVNSLSQSLIKLTAPGVPDFYQGCELWNFSLVDPDNRQPVDFELRRELLSQVKNLSAGEAWKRRADGAPKLWMIRKILGLRAENPALWAASQSYEPLFAWGVKRALVVAFKRGAEFITVVPRLPLTLQNDWAGTTLDLPAGTWSNALTDEGDYAQSVPLSKLLGSFPVAVLTRKGI